MALQRISLLIVPLFILSGCPGIGDRLIPDETAKVSVRNDSVCFQVENARDYQSAFIAVNLRSTPIKERAFVRDVALKIENNELCIPPAVFQFQAGEQYIVEYILTSKKRWNNPRRIVIGLDTSDATVQRIRLTNIETNGPQDF